MLKTTFLSFFTSIKSLYCIIIIIPVISSYNCIYESLPSVLNCLKLSETGGIYRLGQFKTSLVINRFQTVWNPTLSKIWSLMTWRGKEPGHQELWYNILFILEYPSSSTTRFNTSCADLKTKNTAIHCINSLTPRRFQILGNFQANFSEWWLRYLLWNCPRDECH